MWQPDIIIEWINDTGKHCFSHKNFMTIFIYDDGNVPQLQKPTILFHDVNFFLFRLDNLISAAHCRVWLT